VLCTYAAPVSLKDLISKPAASKVHPGAPDPPENRDHYMFDIKNKYISVVPEVN
jgi:hypothetical protein